MVAIADSGKTISMVSLKRQLAGDLITSGFYSYLLPSQRFASLCWVSGRLCWVSGRETVRVLEMQTLPGPPYPASGVLFE